MTSTRPPTASTSPASVTRPGGDAAHRRWRRDRSATRCRMTISPVVGTTRKRPGRPARRRCASASSLTRPSLSMRTTLRSRSSGTSTVYQPNGSRHARVPHHVPRRTAATADDLLVRAGPLGGGARARSRQRGRRGLPARSRRAQRRARATADGLGGAAGGRVRRGLRARCRAGASCARPPRRCGAWSSPRARWCWRCRAAIGRARARGRRITSWSICSSRCFRR